jgi:transglutaminase-like putative cysteine protease
MQTLARMRRLVIESAEAPIVRETAMRIISEKGALRNPLDALLALFEFVRDHVRFKPDPRGVEQLQSPRVTLLARTGDCDDKTTLLIALAEAAGIPASWTMRVIATREPWPLRFNHVFPVAQLGAREIPLDPTYRGTPAGWQHPRPLRIAEVPL